MPKKHTFVILIGLVMMLSACTGVTAEEQPGIVVEVTESAPGGNSGAATAPAPAIILPQDESAGIRILWRVSDYILGKDFSGNEKDLETWRAQGLDMNDTEIIFNKQVCKGVVFSKEKVDATDYLTTRWQETPKSLGIEGVGFEVIKTNCSLFGFSEYMRLEDSRLLVPYSGAWFIFEPNVNK